MEENNTTLMGEAISLEQAAPVSILNEEGRFNAKWYAGDPDLEKYAPQLDKFNDPKGLAKSYANLEKMKAVPGLDADLSQIEAFRRANNIPQDPAEYALSIEQANGIDPAELSKYKETFHRLNLTQSQANELLSFDLKNTEEIENRKIELGIKQLRDEWGSGYEGKLQTAQNIFENLASKSGIDPESVSFLNDPAFAKLMSSVASMLGESSAIGLHSGASSFRSSKEDANDIMKNPNNPDHKALYDPQDPRHKEVFEKVAKMMK